MIANTYPDEVFSEEKIQINTVRPGRTFLEKVFLLHEEFQKQEIRSIKMSRHLYDLEKLMDSDFAQEAMEDKNLYVSIVKHRNTFTHISGVDYKKTSPFFHQYSSSRQHQGKVGKRLQGNATKLYIRRIIRF